MKLGGFGFIKDYVKIKEAGFDYAELDMPEIESLTEKDYENFLELVEKTALPIPTGARLLPITEPTFFTPEYDAKKIEEYVKSSLKKSAKVGIKTIMFGNGKARWLVDNDSIKKEFIFIDFLKMLCESAGEYGQEVLIEPLGPKYSNYINTVPEAKELIEKVNMPNLFAMADIRHFVWSKEPFEDIRIYSDIVKHIHVDYPLSFPERKYPSIRDDYDYEPFFSQLKGYDGTLTIEADVPTDWNRAGTDARELINKYN